MSLKGRRPRTRPPSTGLLAALTRMSGCPAKERSVVLTAKESSLVVPEERKKDDYWYRHAQQPEQYSASKAHPCLLDSATNPTQSTNKRRDGSANVVPATFVLLCRRCAEGPLHAAHHSGARRNPMQSRRNLSALSRRRVLQA